ncbi:hypothetical protein EUX98_g9163 [Antrodiella citrinella]|uniref:Uncharacterized protein n=1 Tax=Antrodiella citrinella TaxID=2447956 RepID=A0A4S4LXA2_9APHY|nr:hypothetical protein EUX98_g9163 [Antrodiella citrinella]
MPRNPRPDHPRSPVEDFSAAIRNVSDDDEERPQQPQRGHIRRDRDRAGASDSESDEAGGNVNIASATRQELITICHQHQVDYQHLCAENRDLRKKIADLELAVRDQPVQPRARGARMIVNSAVIAENFSDIDATARRNAVLVCPFARPQTFMMFDNFTVLVSPDDPARFASASMQQACLIAEILDATPSHMRSFLSHEEYWKISAGACNNVRANTLKNVKGNLKLIFPELIQHLYQNSDGTLGRMLTPAERLHNNTLLHLLGYHSEREKPEEKYDQAPPLLYKDGIVSNERFLIVPALPKIILVILYGASILESYKPAGNSFGVKFKITELTPGLIAFSCIFARFIISGDVSLTETGAVTNMQYIKYFYQYRGLLADIWESSDGRYIRDYYEREVFQRVGLQKVSGQTPTGSAGPQAAVSGGIDSIRAQFAANLRITATNSDDLSYMDIPESTRVSSQGHHSGALVASSGHHDDTNLPERERLLGVPSISLRNSPLTIPSHVPSVSSHAQSRVRIPTPSNVPSPTLSHSPSPIPSRASSPVLSRTPSPKPSHAPSPLVSASRGSKGQGGVSARTASSLELHDEDVVGPSNKRNLKEGSAGSGRRNGVQVLGEKPRRSTRKTGGSSKKDSMI